MTGLKPCPFCAESAVSIDIALPAKFAVYCGKCGTSSGHCKTEQKAADLWNTRIESSPTAPDKQSPTDRTFPSQYRPDDKAVHRFALVMSDKMYDKHAEGKYGWDDEDDCTIEHLVNLLVKHVPKGDPVDVANFCMMLHCRGVTNFQNYLREPHPIASDKPLHIITSTGCSICGTDALHCSFWKTYRPLPSTSDKASVIEAMARVIKSCGLSSMLHGCVVVDPDHTAKTIYGIILDMGASGSIGSPGTPDTSAIRKDAGLEAPASVNPTLDKAGCIKQNEDGLRQSVAQPVDSRAEFEKWCPNEASRHGEGYFSARKDDMWAAWQAAWKLRQPESVNAELVECLEKIQNQADTWHKCIVTADEGLSEQKKLRRFYGGKFFELKGIAKEALARANTQLKDNSDA